MSLKEVRADAEGCVRCSNCKWVDPVYMKSKRFSKICPINARYLYDAYSGQGLMDIALGLIDGKLSYTPMLLDPVYKCTMCGACDTMCKRCLDLEILEVIYRLRAKMVKDGRGPPAAHKTIALDAERTHNIYGEPHSDRAKWVQGATPTKGAETIYFVGCASSYKQQNIARATAKILKVAGIDFDLVDEWCTGAPLYKSGLVDATKRLMEHNLEAVRESGARRVVTSCAECYYMFKVVYPKLLNRNDLGLEVVHASGLIAQLLKDGRLKLAKPLDLKATYHDACHLGRLGEPYIHWEGKLLKYGRHDPPKVFRRGTNGVYAPPRDVLKNIPAVQLKEMERIRENAWCSGGGPELKTAFNDFAVWTAGERIDEVKATGVDSVVTCCPFAKINLLDAAEKRGDRVKVYDLVEVVAEALG